MFLVTTFHNSPSFSMEANKNQSEGCFNDIPTNSSKGTVTLEGSQWESHPYSSQGGSIFNLCFQC